jgi:alpha-mannosidase
MKRATVLAGIVLLSLPAVAFADMPGDTVLARLVGRSRDLVNGYVRTIAGDPMDYHSANPLVRNALLARATDGRRIAEWETAPVPANTKAKSATFVWLAALSGSKGAKKFTLALGRSDVLIFTTQQDSTTKSWTATGPAGVSLTFCATEADRFQDLFGYMFLTVPAPLFTKGAPLTIRVTGEQAESQAWFMVFQHPLVGRIRTRALPALVSATDTVCQPVQVDLEHYGAAREVRIGADSIHAIPVRLEWGVRTVTIAYPAVVADREVSIALFERGKPTVRIPVLLKPVTRRTFYLLPHSHTDIGYSAHQVKVEQDHIRYIDRALALAESTRTFPEGSRFKWNVEVAWELDRYLVQAAPEQRERVAAAIRDGSLGLNALYTNTLTGIQRPEELLRTTAFARKFAREAGVPLTSAMITDIPAYSWSLVTALGLAGVKYFSSGPNYMPQLPDGGDRIGHALRAWGDRPFYWTSSNGEHRVLMWMAGHGYSWFHGWVLGRLSLANPTPLFAYLEDLDSLKYPYDMVQLRYTVDGDNGPPDETLAATVRDWNAAYVSPRIVIATTAEMFDTFERRYGANLPTYSGDLSPYWEDGAASTAKELSANREAAERLVQAEAMFSLAPSGALSAARVDSAWTDVLLFSEHTWGAYNSVSEPDSPSVIAQWEHKKRFIDRAAAAAKELLLPPDLFRDTVSAIDVVNTASWVRTDLVRIPAGLVVPGNRVSDERGTPLPSQRLRDGDLAILVRDVPPLGSRRIRFVAGDPVPPANPVHVEPGKLVGKEISLDIEAKTGAIRSMVWFEKRLELVDDTCWAGLNEYLYVPGTDPRTLVRDSAVTIRQGEAGPLVASWIVESTPAGTRVFRREVSLTAGLGGRIAITDLIDKLPVRSKESVHLAFPFLVPGGEVQLDLGWEVLRPEQEQLPGSCKDFFCMQRWADVSNGQFGVSLASVDAPLVEIGELTDESPGPRGVRRWRDQLPASQTLFAYVMNNYWHTNYKADQEGEALFRFFLLPHGRFDRGSAYRFGVEASQPLLLRAVPLSGDIPGLPLTLIPSQVAVTSLRPTGDGKGWIMRLFNPSIEPDDFLYRWSGPGTGAVYGSDLNGTKGERLRLPITVPPLGVRTIRVERQ